jgi:DNA-binding CsgD family transcriptional regulator
VSINAYWAAHGALVGRDAERSAICRLLDDASVRPAGLVLEGEVGIGKTVLLDEGTELARDRSFLVLRSRPAAAETGFAYGALSDLLAPIGGEILGALDPALQDALGAALLRGERRSRAPDRRAVAAAFLALLEQLAADSPVLLALDDWQWVDRASGRAVAFAVRRLRGPVGLLLARRLPVGATVRDRALPAGESLELPGGLPPERQMVAALDAHSLRRLLQVRTGGLLPPLLDRIERVSSGNPLFALGLAEHLAPYEYTVEIELPASLHELVSHRIRGLSPAIREVLLTASALARPTVAAVEAASQGEAETLLGQAEELGIVTIRGGLVNFTHPVLASGLYAGAAPARRREVHRMLSEVVEGLEERARHLALASVSADPGVLAMLDEAAVEARARGAPSAAAELIELAITLGAREHETCVRAAAYHCEAGIIPRARELLRGVMEELADGPVLARARSVMGTICHRDESFTEAADLFAQALQGLPEESAEWINVSLELCWALTNLGRTAEALPIALRASAAAHKLTDPGLLAEALIVTLILRFMLGQGLSEEGLQEALALEDRDRQTWVWHRPSMLVALILTNVGRVDEASVALSRVRAICAQRGEEAELVYTVILAVQLELWQGRVAEADALVHEAREQASLVRTATARGIAAWADAAVAAWVGREAHAREAAAEALAIFQANGSLAGVLLPLATVGLLDLSLGRSEPVAERLAPLALATVSADATDPAAVRWVADAAEALIALGRTQEARQIVDWLEQRGETLGRVWAVAVGARCRGLLLASDGELSAAHDALARALDAHDVMPSQFERARTLLAVAAVQRRRRERRAAGQTLGEAVGLFERVGAATWLDRARGELERVAPPRRHSEDDLTAAERRVAALAASGMTNREVAAKLFISPKTVEANLARAYRKLDIRSRAELGSRILLLEQHEPKGTQRASPGQALAE